MRSVHMNYKEIRIAFLGNTFVALELLRAGLSIPARVAGILSIWPGPGRPGPCRQRFGSCQSGRIQWQV